MTQGAVISREVVVEISNKFRLSDSFLEPFKHMKPVFGFNGLGELVYMRTYSRIKEDGKNEVWWETVRRVVEGTYNMQRDWIEANGLHWDARRAHRSAHEMYERMFQMKFLPPGRGLWAMGSPLTEEKKLFATLNNCAFVSTENLKEESTKPFLFLMDMSMLGVGVGFDTKGAGKIMVAGVNKSKPMEKFTIPDSREGWVQSLRILLESYFNGGAPVSFDYSIIRAKGLVIKGFGGYTSGPEPLMEMHLNIAKVLELNTGGLITITTIVDIMNLIGKCVVSGNVRRTAEIAFGSPYEAEYLDLKNYKKNPERASYGWTSNNTVFAELGMDYSECAKRTRINGEPGYALLDNMREYGRMGDAPDHKDKRAVGGNPCLEQTLESFELCCLVETFPTNHADKADYLRTLKFAYLYAKTVTLGKTHWPETNRVMLRNRRIGCSMSGVAQFVDQRGIAELKEYCQAGYNEISKWDEIYSDWFAIPKSIKKTSIKPSGTVSLLAGVTPGMHYPESRYYIRRMRLSDDSRLIPGLVKAGYELEPAQKEKSTVIVSVPVDVGQVRTLKDVSMWEQLSLAAFLQKYWADNQVSCTVTFNPDEGAFIEPALNYFQYQIKGVSFLPKAETDAYPQMPYEEITEERYKELSKGLKTITFKNVSNEVAKVEVFCDTEKCEIQA
jgi:ribonucleoside-triphosphate reductase